MRNRSNTEYSWVQKDYGWQQPEQNPFSQQGRNLAVMHGSTLHRVTFSPSTVDQRLAPSRKFREPETFSDSYSEAIGTAIDKARSLLELTNDWDDEGADPISEASWKRATLFLVRYYFWAKREHQIIIPAPKIFPNREGGIDLVWRMNTHRLAFRVPNNGRENAIFTGQRIDGQEIDGSILINNFTDEENLSKLKKTLEIFHTR